ncbi:CBS domain-containing protein [Kribbella sp. NPDC048928]|uniref:CBS domain-containing protein n=1 Tax=Kribbella sp. NPDC048928 TaxID=3364111 RepID=UPI0037205FE6
MSVDVLTVARGPWHRSDPRQFFRGTHSGLLVLAAVVGAGALADGRHGAEPASLVLEFPVVVRPDDHVAQGIEALDRSGCVAVPVLDERRLVGWISSRTALRALRRSVSHSNAEKEEVES